MELKNLFNIQKEKWEKATTYRSFKLPHGLDFCSNDYLGFSQSKDLQDSIVERTKNQGLGSTGSRLLRGHSKKISSFEERLAHFSKMSRALFFATGYQANLALFSGLLKNNAIVFSDSLIHASIIDGIKLSGCEKYIFEHNSPESLESFLRQKADPRKLNVVAIESLYSMGGDKALLAEIVEICEKYGAYLIVDEAHATGLFGDKGAGLVDQEGLNARVLAKIHTGGKALGVSGAWIAAQEEVIEILTNISRPFIYSTAPADYQWVAVGCALDKLEKEYEKLVQQFHEKVVQFQKELVSVTEVLDYEVSGFGGPVTALVLKQNEKALDFSESLAEEGFDVRAIRPPTVPQGEAQLRITIPLTRKNDEIAAFKKSLFQMLRERQ